MITFDAGGGEDPGRLLFGIVRFDPGKERRVRDTLISFDTATAADLLVIREQWTDDYQVTPLRFVVPEQLRPPAGARLPLDEMVARFPTCRRWA